MQHAVKPRKQCEEIARTYLESGVPLEIVYEDLVSAGRVAIRRLAKFTSIHPESCNVFGDFPKHRKLTPDEKAAKCQEVAMGIMEMEVEEDHTRTLTNLIQAGWDCMDQLNQLRIPYPAQCAIFDSPRSYLGA